MHTSIIQIFTLESSIQEDLNKYVISDKSKHWSFDAKQSVLYVIKHDLRVF